MFFFKTSAVLSHHTFVVRACKISARLIFFISMITSNARLASASPAPAIASVETIGLRISNPLWLSRMLIFSRKEATPPLDPLFVVLQGLAHGRSERYRLHLRCLDEFSRLSEIWKKRKPNPLGIRLTLSFRFQDLTLKSRWPELKSLL